MAADPWAPYPTYEAASKGKGKGHPPVPEADAYGVWFIGFVLLIMLASRWSNRR